MNYNPVDQSEVLARFILRRSWVREDKSIKQEVFIPYPHQELSVTRHYALEKDTWAVGIDIAGLRGLELYGRADVEAASVRRHNLDIRPAPESNNPHHVNIINWPQRKEEQKILALEIAAAARFIPAPS